MLIAITGHTAGIGLEMSKWLQNRDHQVLGFSRITGHDISDDAALDRIVAESLQADIFINNATHEFQQTKLLFKLHEVWLGQRKTIVNISSSFTQRWDHGHRLATYRTTKRSLEEGCEFLWNKASWPRIMLAKPCVTDTPKSSWYGHPNKVSAADMADMICSAMMETRCRIQEISFEAIPRD